MATSGLLEGKILQEPEMVRVFGENYLWHRSCFNGLVDESVFDKIFTLNF